MSAEIKIPDNWSDKAKQAAAQQLAVAKKLGVPEHRWLAIINRISQEEWDRDKIEHRGWQMRMEAKSLTMYKTPFHRVYAEKGTPLPPEWAEDEIEPIYTDGKAAVEHGNDYYARHPEMMLKPQYRKL